MVRFDELRIADDYKSLIIEAHVEDYDFYDEMYIKTIYLEYYKNRGTPGVPSDKALLVYENTGDDTSVRSVRAVVNSAALTLEGMGVDTFVEGMFYVYVTCDGNLPASVASMGCDYDNTLDLAVVVDWKFLYTLGMGFVARLADSCNMCEDAADFEQYILFWNAMKFAVDTCDWTQLERFWPALVGTAGDFPATGCGCNK